MATVNLGRIKPVFRGAYNSATAYVVDDIVTSGGETFICILASTGNATSNATYWTKLAQKGTDGTDVGTTLTTHGDILYRDGSGLQRLGAGTAGHVLKTNGANQAPSWGADEGGAILQTKMIATNNQASFANNTPVNWTALNMTFTPTASDSILELKCFLQVSAISTSVGGYFYDNTNSVRVGVGLSQSSRQRLGFRTASQHSSAWMVPMVGHAYYALGNTNATDFRIYLGSHGGTTTYLNRNVNHPNTTNIDDGVTQSTFMITEYRYGKFTGSSQQNA